MGFRSFLAMVLIITGTLLSKTFIIGVENIKYYPHYSNENGEYSGYARAVLDAFAEKKGYTFIYNLMPVKRLYGEFLSGKVDFKYPDNPLWMGDAKKGKKIEYSKPVAEYIDGVMVLKENKKKGKSFLKNLGTVRGFTAWKYLDEMKKGKIKFHENSTFEGLLKQVILGRIDGAYINVAVAEYQLNKILNKKGSLVFDSSLPFEKDNYYLSSIKHSDILEEFNFFLKKEKKLIKSLKKKYGIK